ncbi:MAG TPA: efflux RND transporter periplasmic adaptor subunit [Longimicrobiales bacterium]
MLRKGLAATVALLAGVAVLACGASEATESDAGLELAAVERRDLEVLAEAAGLIEPVRLVEVKSKASGEVLRIHVETGQEVERGTLLVEIDPRDVRNAFAQAEADLAVAKARLATAEAQRQRIEELRKANVVTEQEFETAALEEANARAQFVKARTNLELARERLGDVTVRAPIDGTIIQRSVEIGTIIASASQNISGGTPLMLMADLSQMQVRTLVDETDIGRIRPGQVARVLVEAYPGRPFIGRVLKIEPQAVVDQNVTMFPVLVLLDNDQRLLKPGMNAEVQIEIARRDDVLTVPNAAVVGVRDMVTAGVMLGLDEQTLHAALRGGAGAPGGEEARTDGAAQAADGDGQGTSAAGDQAGEEPPRTAADCAALRERIRAGGLASLTDAERARLRECRRAPGADGAPGTFRGAGRGTSGEMVSRPRPAFVFVMTPDGPQPRRVVIGLNDWDHTEVVRGVEPGEQVVLLSVARLQQQQQEFANRVRERAGGVFPGQRGRR